MPTLSNFFTRYGGQPARPPIPRPGRRRETGGETPGYPADSCRISLPLPYGERIEVRGIELLSFTPHPFGLMPFRAKPIPLPAVERGLTTVAWALPSG